MNSAQKSHTQRSQNIHNSSDNIHIRVSRILGRADEYAQPPARGGHVAAYRRMQAASPPAGEASRVQNPPAERGPQGDLF